LGTGYPRIPGHEVYGLVDKLGAGVIQFKEGEHIGVGWFGGAACEGGNCKSCVAGSRVCCEKGLVTGAHLDGGYAEYMIARQDSIAKLPSDLTPEKAAPLMCAGITMYNALRNSKAKAGDVVVISGIGGLGHLGIQYASKMGFDVVATSRDASKKDLAHKLGAHHYIDASKEDVTGAIQKLGGAKVIIYTATSGKGLETILPALAVEGEVIMVAALNEPVAINTTTLLFKRASIKGWASGDNRDIQDTVAFSKLTNINPMVEVYTWDKVHEAFDRMMDSKAEFRVVMSGGWDKVTVK